jgi:hypothetical protein
VDSRTIKIDVDEASWKGSVPSAITTLKSKGSISISVDVALLITALITRPPEILGFSLADAWAWLRYRPALTETDDLRLRLEWKDIDPHQKTILSDELGMGVTTYLLALELDFKIIANTLYFVKAVAPSSYFLATSTKNGQRKSPDFVALDSQNRVSAFECKGTQESKTRLKKLTKKGIPQKQNLKARAGSSLLHALVVGLFIPQFSNSEDALIHLRDPEDSKFDELLKSVSHEQQVIAIVQISLAKHFALMGLQSIANALARRTVENNPSLQDVDDEEVSRATASARDFFVFQTELRLPVGTLTVNNSDVTAMKFSMSCLNDVYLRLIKNNDLNSELLRLAELAAKHPWVSSQAERKTNLITPLGFNLSLEYSTQPSRAERHDVVDSPGKKPSQENLF